MVLLQTPPPSDTWFAKSPEWGWLIVVYFFLGGSPAGPPFSPVCSICLATGWIGA